MKLAAPPEDQFVKMTDGQFLNVTIVERLPDHEEYWLNKKKGEHAHVYKVRDQSGKTWKLTVSSTQLYKTLQLLEKYAGTIMNVPFKLTARGEEKERTYEIDVADDVPTQQRISVETTPNAPDELKGQLTVGKKPKAK